MEAPFEKRFKHDYGKHFSLYTTQEVLDMGLFGHGNKHPFVDHCLGEYIAIAKGPYYFELVKYKPHLAHHASLSQDEMEVPLITLIGDAL